MVPEWLHSVAVVSLALGGLCALVIAIKPVNVWLIKRGIKEAM